MVAQMLLGYPYSVLRPETDSWMRTVCPDLAFWLTRIVTTMVRPPLFGSGSSWNAGVVGGRGGLGWFTMWSAMLRNPETFPSNCHCVDQSRRCSTPLLIRHWTHRLPGLRVTAFVCVYTRRDIPG